jgi:hypothetical protein
MEQIIASGFVEAVIENIPACGRDIFNLPFTRLGRVI